MAYNTSFMQDPNFVNGILSGINQNSNNLFSTLLLFVLFVIILIATKGSLSIRITTSGFIVTILSILSYLIGWSPGHIISIFIVITIIGLVLIIWGEDV
jgi:hypothetical protein